jgi:hypothetical protein
MFKLFFFYIDPGTGSLILSALIGMSMTFLFKIRGSYYSIVNLLFGLNSKFNFDFSGKIVFYSEGESYWRVYKPVILELIRNNEHFVYLSSDKKDPGLAFNNYCVETFYLGNIRESIFILNRLKANLCVMTTPQLDVISLKRSKDVKHYCHIIHSPTDIHAYKKFAFDYFDSVLCSSKYQILSLRSLEEKRKTKVKELLPVGCTYFDLVSDNSNNDIGTSILIAPTWGDRTFFKYCGKEIIQILLNAGHEIIYRPHPQSWISDRDLLDSILSTFESNPKLSIDRETNSENSINKSNLLICDITSGMLYDMAFTHNKPVLGINFKWNDGGYESSSLEHENSALQFLKDIGEVLHISEVHNLAKIVKRISANKISKNIIDKHIFNFKKSGKIAAQQISLINNNLK